MNQNLTNRNSTLDMALRQSITDRAIWLRDTELSVRDQLAQLGAIINASENVRLQKTVAKLTRWIVVLTVLAVILAAAQLLSIDWNILCRTSETSPPHQQENYGPGHLNTYASVAR